MAEGKNSFVLYTDQKEIFKALDNEQAGKLIKHIFDYVTDENPTTDDAIVRAVFIGIQQALKRDLKKWEAKQEQRKQAGMESARKRKEASKIADQITKKSTTVNIRQHPSTVSGSVNGNGNGSVNVLSKNGESENARAIDYLKINFPSRFEADFLMKYKSKIENPKKFAEDFNDTVDQEQLEFSDRVLFGRLGKYARNWIENQDKYSKSNNQDDNSSYNVPVG
ncbi:DUF6291 domain-containing protein [Xanthomarina gelatinilytica]|uniref:DUF6291 domain-containing protein n=1 Tax=Xanthomarina gelatinilytica TaxID=1137281 RepID=UPI003AA94D9D